MLWEPSSIRFACSASEATKMIPAGASVLVSYAQASVRSGRVLPEAPPLRSWVLDSGAFSVFRGQVKAIDLEEFSASSAAWQQRDPLLVEVFALDVIGDHVASLANARAMRDRGVHVTPTFHLGSPWSAFDAMLEEFPRVALGGMVGHKGRRKILLDWMRSCFARAWPRRIHLFGVMAPALLDAVPFYSCDSSTWARWSRLAAICGERRGRLAYGTTAACVGRDVSMDRAFRRQYIHTFLRLERQMRSRWSATWEQVKDDVLEIEARIARRKEWA